MVSCVCVRVVVNYSGLRITSLSIKMSRLARDRTAEPVLRDQILRRERGQENINFPCSADHGQDWQPYPVDPYSCYMCGYTYDLSRITSCNYYLWSAEQGQGIFPVPVLA